MSREGEEKWYRKKANHKVQLQNEKKAEKGEKALKRLTFVELYLCWLFLREKIRDQFSD